MAAKLTKQLAKSQVTREPNAERDVRLDFAPGVSGDVEDLDAFRVAVAADHHERVAEAQKTGASAEVLARVWPSYPINVR